jgi:hypothetical protein
VVGSEANAALSYAGLPPAKRTAEGAALAIRNIQDQGFRV